MPNVPRALEDAILDAQIELLRLEAGVRRKVLAVLSELRREIIDRLARGDVTDFQSKRMSALLDDIEAITGRSYGRIRTIMQDDMIGVAMHSTGVANAVVAGALGAEVPVPRVTKETVRRIVSNVLVDGGHIGEWIAQQERRTADRFVREIRKGVIAQETVGQIAKRIRGYGEQGGALAVSRREATALVRTAVIAVGNEARLRQMLENPMIRGVQWVSTLDERTTPICRALDGKKWDKDLEPIGHKFPFPGPTAHWNCRSTQVPVLSAYSDIIEDKKLAAILSKLDLDQTTRASMDGPVPAGTTYPVWFKRQSETRQRAILGPGRYDLWVKGKLSFEDMVDQSGRALTLDQLRSL